MRIMGPTGVRRGKRTITTVSNPKAPCPLDKVNREFRVARPNALRLVDFSYVHTWAGFVYVAFVIDAYARRIVGWKVSTSPTAGFVLDASFYGSILAGQARRHFSPEPTQVLTLPHQWPTWRE
ncbi:integrase [Novosphingobium sp. Rr 2-17]|nr:integrase [Novosphingobium sp. Rr 2-17]